jgi:hypothetical protein
MPEDDEPSYGSDEDEWIVPYDFDGSDGSDRYHELFPPNDYSDWDSNALNDDRLASLIRKLPTKKNVVIIDACLAGGFIGSSHDADTAPQDYSQSNNKTQRFGDAFRSYFSSDASADLAWTDGIAITASGETELAYEDTGYAGGTPTLKHGYFTYGLLEAASNDTDNDGYISTMELYSYARAYIEQVFNDSPNINESQHYLPRISGGPVDFLLFEAD